MSRRPASLAVALVLAAFGLRWVWNSNGWSGPVVVTLTPSHGVHLHDWLTIVLWALAITTAFPVWVRELTLRLRHAVLGRQR